MKQIILCFIVATLFFAFFIAISSLLDVPTTPIKYALFGLVFSNILLLTLYSDSLLNLSKERYKVKLLMEKIEQIEKPF